MQECTLKEASKILKLRQVVERQVEIANNLPSTLQTTLLNSVPSGVGFLRMKERKGKPPYFVVVGDQELIDSSKILQ